MVVYLESNFVLPGDNDLGSIDLGRTHVTLAELFEELSARSGNYIDFLTSDRRALDEGWDVSVNGCPFTDLPRGLGTPLRDGDRVAVKLLPIGGG
ncbi:MAG: MoaD/ThiS family protein [Pseudomonadota bacterium]